MLSAEPVCSCAHSLCAIARETAGAARTRSSLRPPVVEGETEAIARAFRAARMRTCSLAVADTRLRRGGLDLDRTDGVTMDMAEEIAR